MSDLKSPTVTYDTAAHTLTPVLNETITFLTLAGAVDAGEAVGTIVYANLLKAPVYNLIGDRIGDYNPASFLESSLVFTTGVMDSTLQYGFIFSANEDDRLTKTADYLSLKANGAWAIDYETGLIIIKKKTTGTSQLITSYNVKTQGGGDSATSSSSSAVGGGASGYSNVQGDFTATANSGAKTITFSAYASTILSASITTKNFASAVIKRITSAGVVDTLPLTNIAFSANVLTLSDMTADFAVGDTVAVFIPGNDKAFDETNDATKVYLISRLAGEKINNDRLDTTKKYTTKTHITTATTTTIHSGANILGKLFINATTTGTIKIYDGTVGAGNLYFDYPLGLVAGTVIEFDQDMGTSLIVVTSAADNITVTSSPTVAES